VPKSSVKLANKKREQAAFLVAEDRHSDSKIAEICGISERALGKWKNRPEFAERVEELTAIFADRVLKFGLARRERRLTVLSDMHERMLRVIDERSNDPELATIPGGRTGLVVGRQRGIRNGAGLQLIQHYEVDVALLRELRATEEQIARELGQRDKPEDDNVDQEDLVRRLKMAHQRMAALKLQRLAASERTSENQ
jgi:hypothetical protein